MSQRVYTFLDMVRNIQGWGWCYSQCCRVCTSSVIWFLICKGEDDVNLNVSGGVPPLWYDLYYPRREMMLLPMLQAVYHLCEMVHNIQGGRWCYSQCCRVCTPSYMFHYIERKNWCYFQCRKGCTLIILWFVTSKGMDGVTPNVAGGVLPL